MKEEVVSPLNGVVRRSCSAVLGFLWEDGAGLLSEEERGSLNLNYVHTATVVPVSLQSSLFAVLYASVCGKLNLMCNLIWV